jgi:putative membrane protein
MEDLPPEVSHFANHYNAVVIDPHNSYSERFSGLTEEDVRSIKEAIPDALNSSSRACGKFSVGLARIVPTNYGLSDGLGVGGFSLLGLAVSDMRVALAVIDGNNALPSVRDSVIETLKNEGWTAAELLTTDTHMVNGVSLGGKGYYAVGEKIPPSEVSEIFAELSKSVLADMREAEVKYVKIRHEYSKIFSEDLLERLAKKSSHLLIIYLFLMVLSFVLPLIIF